MRVDGNVQRVPASFAASQIFVKNNAGTSMFDNTSQRYSSGKYLEYECSNAFIVASHSQPSLNGCSLSAFILLTIAELSNRKDYVPFDSIIGFPG